MVFPVLGILLRRDSHITVDVLPHFLSGKRLRYLRDTCPDDLPAGHSVDGNLRYLHNQLLR